MEDFYSKALGFGLLLLAAFFIYYFRSQYSKNPNNYSPLSVAQGAAIVIITFTVGVILLLGIVNFNNVKPTLNDSENSISLSILADLPPLPLA